MLAILLAVSIAANDAPRSASLVPVDDTAALRAYAYDQRMAPNNYRTAFAIALTMIIGIALGGITASLSCLALWHADRTRGLCFQS